MNKLKPEDKFSLKKAIVRFEDYWDKPLSNSFQRFSQLIAIVGVLITVFFAYRTIELTEEAEKLTIKYGENQDQLKALTKIIRFSQSQESYRNRLDSVTRKVNIIKLRKAYRNLTEIKGYNIWKFGEQQDESLYNMQLILEREMENPVLLDDSIISISWIRIYNELVRTRESAHGTYFQATIGKKATNGKEKIKIVNTTKEDRDKYINQFLSDYSNFFHQFQDFIHKKNKEINVFFD